MGKKVAVEIELLDRLSGGLDRLNRKMDAFSESTSDAKKKVGELEGVSGRVRSALMKLGAAFTMRELVTNVVNVRGEFEKLEVAFETMLGSAERAQTLMSQMVQTAATTPFGLDEVAQGAKQLLAFGMAAENVNSTLVRLGDIAAGLSIPLNDLIYLYGTTMAQGRLYTQDLNQFTGRGIPMIKELALQFGVAESKVKELVESGKVGFPEVQKVIESLTDEGGKFGGLMEAQSKTISGQISNIQDSIDRMFNALGKQSEGMINTALGGVSYLVEHYEQIGRVLLGVAATYGTYRTALMLAAAAQGWATAAEALHYNWLLLVEKAQKMLNATMLANPYVLVATAISGVVAVMVSMKTEAEKLREAEEAYEAQKRKTLAAEEEHRRRMEELCSIAGNEATATDTRREALNELEKKYPDIFAKYDTEYDKLKNIKQIKQEIALLDGKESMANPENELKRVNDRIRELEAKRATEKWEEANASGSRMKKVGGLSGDEAVELKNLHNKRGTLAAQVHKQEVEAYFENLTGVSNATLSEQINQRETLLARMKMQEAKYGKIAYGNDELRGTYTRDELQYQLNKLRGEQTRRNKPVDSSADWVESAKKRYQEALKAYNDFIKDGSNKLTQEDFEKRAKELKDAVDGAKKEYDKVKPGADSDEEKNRKAAEKASREAEKRKRLAEKSGQELADLQRENDAAEVDMMEEGLEKKLRQIENDYEARKNAIARQEAEWKRTNKEAGMPTVGNGLTSDQTDALAAARDLNDRHRRAALAATLEEEKEKEAAAMRDYLSEYGNYEEKRLAMAQEYEKRIAEATTEGGQKTLQEELKKKMADLDMEELRDGLDWESVFGDLDKVSTESLQSLRSRLQEYLAAQKNLQPDSLKDLVRAIESIDKKLNERNPFAALRTSISQLRSTTLSAMEAQEAYNKAVEEGTEAEQQNAKATLDAARNAKQKALAEATESLHSSVGQVKEYVGAAEDLVGLVKQFGMDPPEWMGEWLEGMGQTLDGLESIDLTRPMSILSGGIKALGGVAKQVFSLGGLINWSGSNAKEVQATMERLTYRNEMLQTSIEDLTDTIRQSRGTKSVAAYRDAYKMQEETNRNYLEMAMAQAGYHGSHHSWNYYWGGFSQEQIDKINEQIGGGWDGDLWSLSPEEMKVLRSNVDLWTQIQATGKGGYGGRLTEKLDDYIAQAGKLEELTDQLYEGLTAISFDGMYSSFIDNLMNMKYGAKDAAEDISEYFMRAMLSNKIGELYSEKLKDWWEKFGEAMKDNDLDEKERDALMKEYMEYVDEALALRDNLAAATGYDKTEAGGSRQSAKSGGFTAMTQDQGTKLEGLFASGLQHWSSMDEKMESVVEKMDTAEGHLARIAENTGVSAGHLGELKEVIKKMIRDGLKVK